MKKLLIVVVTVIIVFVVLNYTMSTKNAIPTLTYTFEFDNLDKDFWFVGNWGSLKSNYDAVDLRDGILRMTSDGQISSPYMLSMPILLRDGDVITLNRRVRIKHGEGPFNAGVSMFQTNSELLQPTETDGNWQSSFGDGVFLIEYSYDFSQTQKRPGKDIVRVLPADWEYNQNYQLVPPIYDEWFDESIIFDTRSSHIEYKVNGKTYKLNSYQMDRASIRFMVHPYSLGPGGLVEMDKLEIIVENKKARRQK